MKGRRYTQSRQGDLGRQCRRDGWEWNVATRAPSARGRLQPAANL